MYRVSCTRLAAHDLGRLLQCLKAHVQLTLLFPCLISQCLHASPVSVCLMQALTDALMSGHLGGAGLDVHWVVSMLSMSSSKRTAAVNSVSLSLWMSKDCCAQVCCLQHL